MVANFTAGPFVLTLSNAQIATLLALAAGDHFAYSRGGTSGIGDAVLRVRPASWTLKSRRVPSTFAALRGYPLWSSWHTSPNGVQILMPEDGAFATADLTAALIAEPSTPTGVPLPLKLTRSWAVGHDNKSLVLRFRLANLATEALEVGGLGAALPFEWNAGTAVGDAASTFLDPAINGQHG